MNEEFLDAEINENDIFGTDYGDDFGEDVEDLLEDPYYSEDSEAAGFLSPSVRKRLLAQRIRQAKWRALRGPYLTPPRRRRRNLLKPARQVVKVARDNRRAIKKVNLKANVQSDILAQRIAANQKRIGGTEYAVAALRVVDEFKDRIPSIGDNKILQTALPLLPLWFLKPSSKRKGIDAFLLDPRILATAAAVAVAVIQGFRKKDDKPKK